MPTNLITKDTSGYQKIKKQIDRFIQQNVKSDFRYYNIDNFNPFLPIIKLLL